MKDSKLILSFQCFKKGKG